MSNTDPAFAPDYPVVDSGGDLAAAGSDSQDRTGDHSTAEPTPSQADGASASQRAADLAGTSAAAGQHVAGVAADEVHRVGSETKQQATDLYRQTQSELSDQAAAQQKRVASGIRSLGDEFSSMAESSQAQGVASDLAHQAATRAAGIADWLDQRDPGALLDELKGYARRRPGTFIAIAAVAGIVAGRLTRGVIADKKDNTDTTPDLTGTPR